MANGDYAFGFRPVMHGAGGMPARLGEYAIADSTGTGYGTSIGYGDLVKLAGDGTIQLATAGDQMVGIFQGCRYVASDGSQVFSKNWVASTVVKTGSITALVYDDPHGIYEVQADTSTTQASVGQFADLVASAVNSLGVSTMSVVHGSTEDSLQIVKVVTDKPVRDANGYQALSATGTYAIVHVRPIQHQLSGVGTVVAEV
jgi:hypothetical protein